MGRQPSSTGCSWGRRAKKDHSSQADDSKDNGKCKKKGLEKVVRASKSFWQKGTLVGT